MSPVCSRVMAETRKALLERLFAQHGAALLAFFYQRVRRRPDAAELAQEVYLRTLRASDIGAIRNPEAYLYTVASNLAKEHRLLEQRSANTLDIDDPAELLADL